MSAVKHAARTAAAVFVLGLSVTASPAVALADTTEEAAPASEAADSAATSISGRTAAPEDLGTRLRSARAGGERSRRPPG